MFTGIVVEAIKIGCVFLFGCVGEIIIEKSGHLNLGLPGIMSFGAIGGCMGSYYAYQISSSAFLIILMGIIGATIFGALGGLLYGFFTITLRCNQNVVGLVISTFGAGAVGFWSTLIGQKGIKFFGVSILCRKPLIPINSDDFFSQVFLKQSPFIYIAIIIAIIASFVLLKTKTGLALRAIGENPSAADAQGINISKYKYLACIIGSAIAGIGGAYYYLVCTSGSVEPGVIDARGWIALALVIFTLWRPSLSIFGSFIFGFLFIIKNYINGIGFAEKELLEIIPYLITAIVIIIISFFKKKETQPPSALGLTYFREER